jgi:hypothetical protein
MSCLCFNVSRNSDADEWEVPADVIEVAIDCAELLAARDFEEGALESVVLCIVEEECTSDCCSSLLFDGRGFMRMSLCFDFGKANGE